jgi:hypothetical protein
MKQIFKIFIILLIIVTIGYQFFYCFKIKKEYDNLKSDYQNLQSRFDLLYEEANQPSSVQGFEPLLGHYKLKITIEELKKDLQKHSDLIPIQGFHGSKMRFYSLDKIFLLNSKWVLAYFEDGHNSGNALLEYNISKNNNITWKVIAAFAD